MKKYLNLVILLSIFIISIYLRLDAYLINNSFFTDEVLLFANIFSKNYFDLIQPLQFYQSAPYIFLILSKLISSNVGITELCLRFIPFFSGILSVFFFYKLTSVVFKTNLPKYIALLAFGLNYQLLFYSQAFKQYSTDVLIVTIFLYLVLKYFQNIQNLKQYTFLGLISMFGIFVSFPMLILVPAVYIVLFFIKRHFFKLLYSALFPAFGLTIYYLFNFQYINNSSYLHNYWEKGFQIFSLEFYKMNFDFLFTYYAFPVLAVILLIIGFYFLYKNNKFLFSIFAVAIFNTLLLAYLKIYPCERRLILFLLPILLIIMIYPLDNLKKNVTSLVTIIISCVFLGYGFFNFSKNYILGNVSYLRQDVKPLLQKIINKNDNEKVYVYYGAVSTYSYYSMTYNLPGNVYFATYPDDEKYSELFLQKDIKSLPYGIFYILFIKGTDTYEKDINYIEPWLKSNYEILSIDTLKSAKLIKFKIR